MTDSKARYRSARSKRLAVLMTAAALTAGLAACGSDSETDREPSSSASTSAETPPTETTSSDNARESQAEGTAITITAGDTEFAATLNDSDAAQDFAELLPVNLPATRISGIEYLMELSAPLTETGPFYTTVEPGDIVYWNPRNSITVIYEETSSVSELTKLGEVTSDLDAFEALPDDVDMQIEAG